MPAKEYFEGISEIDKESPPGAKRLVAEIDYEIQVARFRAESSSGGRTENLQAFDVKLPAQLDNLFDFAVEGWKRCVWIHHLNLGPNSSRRSHIRAGAFIGTAQQGF